MTEPLRSQPNSSYADRARSGDDVLDWLRTAQAHNAARRALCRWGLPADGSLADDVLSDAAVSVLRRMQSPEPLLADVPAAYGTVVVRQAVRRLARGRSASVEGDPFVLAELAALQQADATANAADPTADQAICWPALWLAGERDLFPDDDGTDGAAQRRTRARRIRAVQDRLEQVYAQLRLAGVASHG